MYFVLLIICVSTYLIYLICKPKLNYPPGPRSWPIVGTLHNLYSDYWGLVKEWRETYGPVVMFYRFGTRFVYINDYKIGYKAFVTEYPNELAGRPLNGIDQLSVGDMEVFFTRSMSPQFVELRKMIMRSLRFVAEPGKMTEISNRAFDLFKQHVLEERYPIDNEKGYFVEELNYWIGHNLLVRCFWGECVEFDNEDYLQTINLIRTLQQSVGDVQYFDQMPRFLTRLPFPQRKRVLQNSTNFSNFIRKKLVARRKSGQYKNDPKYFIDIALQIQDDNNNNNSKYPNLPTFDDFFIANLTIDNYLAGMDGFGIGFTWAIGILATNPKIVDNIREEYYKNKSQNPTKPFHILMDDLHYTNAVINEIYRFNSLSTLTSFHRAQEDCKVDQYDVPKDTIVVLDIMSMHFNPEVWPEPYIFKPERFLDENGKFSKPKYGYMPFGVGKRTCTAERYVVKESHFVFIIRMVTEFDLKWMDSNPTDYVVPRFDPMLFRRCEKFYVKFIERKTFIE